MAKIQDIDIPYLEFAEASAPGTPASGIVRIYAKTDGSLYQKDDAGTETGLAGGGGGMSDPMTTRGDIIIRNSSNTTARLAVGSARRVFKSDGTDPSWGVLPFIGCKVYHTSTQTINPSGVLSFGSEEYDTDTLHDTGSNTSRITIPSGLDGKWLLAAGTGLISNTNGGTIGFRLNGSTMLRGNDWVSGSGGHQCTIVAALAAADYVEVYIANTSGSANYGHASAPESQSWFSATFLGN